MLRKQQVIKSIQQLPDQFSVDDLIERVIVLQKIERGLMQSQKGEIIPDSDLEKIKLSKWLS